VRTIALSIRTATPAAGFGEALGDAYRAPPTEDMQAAPPPGPLPGAGRSAFGDAPAGWVPQSGGRH